LKLRCDAGFGLFSYWTVKESNRISMWNSWKLGANYWPKFNMVD